MLYYFRKQTKAGENSKENETYETLGIFYFLTLRLWGIARTETNNVQLNRYIFVKNYLDKTELIQQKYLLFVNFQNQTTIMTVQTLTAKSQFTPSVGPCGYSHESSSLTQLTRSIIQHLICTLI